MKMGDGPNDAGLSRHHLIAACEASLKRLGTDWIDLYQLHEWDGQTPLDETLRALDDLVRSGKVRYVGCSNYTGWQLMKALGVAERQGLERFVSQQIHYTLEAREAEYELVPIAVDQGVGIMVWGPLAGGLLSGKYRRGQPHPPGSRHLNEWGEPPIRNEGRLYDIIETLVGHRRRARRAGLAGRSGLALGRPGICTVVIGARNEEQLAGNLGAAELSLSDDERARLDKISALPLLYPYWHQARTSADRLVLPTWPCSSLTSERRSSPLETGAVEMDDLERVQVDTRGAAQVDDDQRVAIEVRAHGERRAAAVLQN